jgi:site-specific DNA-methyltransferase (adenine-specific)
MGEERLLNPFGCAKVFRNHLVTPVSKTTAKRAPRNRTIEVAETEKNALQACMVEGAELSTGNHLRDSIIHGDAFEILPMLASGTIDLLFADPPYNLTKSFGSERFVQKDGLEYEEWLDSWLKLCMPLLKATASIYICGDWRSSAAIQRVGSKYFHMRNRITWEREKGRGAKANWKNACEDIWFFTRSDVYTFNLDAVKIRRRVLAPYRQNGEPRDWHAQKNGNFRDTHPSNIWTDISVPFWSMPENTDHPTQKPEKLMAKIILASTNPGDLILDPFAGSGTTVVTATKLGRDFVAIESDERYCLLTLKRLAIAKTDHCIQGFSDGVFWERNSGPNRT